MLVNIYDLSYRPPNIYNYYHCSCTLNYHDIYHTKDWKYEPAQNTWIGA